MGPNVKFDVRPANREPMCQFDVPSKCMCN
jgi:hypothetical protein